MNKYNGIIYSTRPDMRDKDELNPRQIATLTLRNGANIFSPEFMDNFTARCTEIAANKEISAIVIKSDHPQFFSTGADIKYLHSILGKEQPNEAYAKQVVQMFNAYASIEKPILIYSRQTAVGGGVYFFTANKNSLAVLDHGAQFNFTNIDNSGLVPIAGAPALIEKIGIENTKKVLSGRGELPSGVKGGGTDSLKNIDLSRGISVHKTSAIENGLVRGTDEGFDRDPEWMLKWYNDILARNKKMGENLCFPVKLTISSTIDNMVDRVAAAMVKGKQTLDSTIVEMLTENFISEAGQKGIVDFVKRIGRPGPQS